MRRSAKYPLRAAKDYEKLGVTGVGGVMNSSGCATVLGIAIAVCWGEPVSSAIIKSSAGKHGGVVITLSGPIITGDSDIFIREVKQANAAGKSVENVQLNSGGGRLTEGVKLAATIKEAGISTVVGQGAVCASACFLIFAAGDPKFVGDGARVGVHKASDKDGRETMSSGVATESMAHFARELGVPSSIISRMVSTPSKQIVWLDSQDLKAMGVSLAGVPAQTRRVATSGLSVQQASTSLSAWNVFIDNAAKLSADQNGGEPAVSRHCQPELNNCVLGLEYLLNDGRKGLAVVIQDVNGRTLRREACEFNSSSDMMECVDWESGTKHRDAKNDKGDWVQAPGQ
jgi:hypothetical protein